MKATTLSVMAVLMLTGISAAKELPDAPSAVMAADAYFVEVPQPAPAPKVFESKPIDTKFLSLAAVSAGSTFADS